MNSGIGIGCIINRTGGGSHWKPGRTSQPFFSVGGFSKVHGAQVADQIPKLETSALAFCGMAIFLWGVSSLIMT